MDNIAKFEKIKQLNKLKAELHKKELQSYMSLEKYKDVLSPKWGQIMDLTKLGFTLYKVVKPFVQNTEQR